MTWNRRHVVISGLVLILATNAVALAGVAFNRHGEPDSTLVLSERELVPPTMWRRGTENSGLAAQIRWRVLDTPSGGSGVYRDSGFGDSGFGDGAPEWLGEVKLTELGFDIAQLKGSGDRDVAPRRLPLPRDVLVVLEMDGPAYAKSVARAEAAASDLIAKNEDGRGQEAADHMLGLEHLRASRLFAVDAGVDRAALRATYADRTRYAIVHAQIRPYRVAPGRGVSGFIVEPGGGAVNVPWQLRGVFASAQGETDDGPAPGHHYRATVAFGQRLEPWIVGVEGQ